MKRISIACAAAVAIGAGIATAASPQIEGAIKVIQAAGTDAAKMKAFCDLIDLEGDADDEAGGSAAPKEENPAIARQEDALLTQLGADFEAAWDAGGDLDENSADGKEFDAAVDALAEKCQ